MNKIPKAIWIILGLAGVAYAAWSVVYPHGTWRYKMTVVVDTPEGIKIGSVVREVEGWCEPKIFPEQSACHATVIKGEAVVVDLGKRGVLFAIMRGAEGTDYAHNIVFEAFPNSKALSPDGIKYYRSLSAGQEVLTQGQYPMMVYFKNLEDPKTVESIVDFKDVSNVWPPQHMIEKDHMEEIFGQGVKLKEITIEMTDEPVTDGVKKYLPWVSNISDNIDGTMFTSSNKLSNVLNLWDFEKGFK